MDASNSSQSGAMDDPSSVSSNSSTGTNAVGGQQVVSEENGLMENEKSLGGRHHKSRNIPVRAIHYLHQVQGGNGEDVSLDGSGALGGGSQLTQGGVQQIVTQSVPVNSGKSKNPSPVPIRKSSPRSSPRTSPLPRGSSPAHCRSPSPHFNHRSSPRASPVSSGTWTSGVGGRNKSPHHHTKLQGPTSSAFNKVSGGGSAGIGSNNASNSNSLNTSSSSVKRGSGDQQQQQQQQMTGSAFTGVGNSRNGITHGLSSSSSAPIIVPAGSAALGGSGGAGSSSNSTTPVGGVTANVPLVLASSGGNSRNSWSPVMVSGIPRSLMPNSPKFSSSASTTSSSGGSAVGGHRRSSSVTNTSSSSIHQRQDPTSRDLEFLLGGCDDDLLDDPGFGSDNELIYYGSRYEENNSTGYKKRPASSNAAVTKSSSKVAETEDGRPKSCTVSNGSGGGVSSPVYDRKQHQQPAAQSPAQQHDVDEAFGGDEKVDTNEEPQQRGRTVTNSKQRWRSASWDSLRSQQSKHNVHKNLKMFQQQQQQIHQASLTRQQIKMQQQQKMQMQLQQHQQKHQQEQQQLLMQQMQQSGTMSLDSINGLSLEDVFQLERMLSSYKAQLLRERVFSSAGSNSENAHSAGNVQQQQQQQQQQHPDYDTFLENKYLVHSAGAHGYAPPHPPERCGSGNCILDDIDETVLGAMDFDDYEATYQFNHQVDDHYQAGMRAPNFKMFKSYDRSGYISSPSSIASSGTAISNDETVEEVVSRINEGISSLSRSPGNISFISGRTKLNTNPIIARMKSPPNVQHLRNSIEARLTAPDPSKGIESISSPRSAFSRASTFNQQEQQGAGAVGVSGSASSASRPIRVNSSLNSSSSSANNRSFHRGRSNGLS